jgi:hypothetical protein
MIIWVSAIMQCDTTAAAAPMQYGVATCAAAIRRRTVDDVSH